jgi:type III pantothenate kinase
MNLVIDIGNSQTKAGWFETGILIDSRKVLLSSQEDVKALFSIYPVEMAIISSVGQTESNLFTAAALTCRFLYLHHTTPQPLIIRYNTPETLGRDRIAAATGAWSLYPRRNILVADMGTAITIDFVTAAGEYLGGNISPGLQTRFHSLHDRTARLPLAHKNKDFPVLGKDTQSAIITGVQQGIIYELNGYITDFENRYPDCAFVFTGGDASFFVPMLKRTIFAMPDLVLIGLNQILEFNRSRITE